MLTKKDFNAIATALRERQPLNDSAKLGYHLAITAVANGLQRTNPAFNRALFIDACCEPGNVPPPEDQLHLLARA